MRIAVQIFRRFSLQDKVKTSLAQIKLQNGTPLLDSKLLHSVTVDEGTQTARIELGLDVNFRRLKSVISESLSYIPNLDIKMAPRQQLSTDPKANIAKVKKVIAVYSCKGGVGKSTVAVNLAFALKAKGKQVGIFDADLFGPSLPTLLRKQGQTIEPKEQGSKDIKAIEHEGVKAMSFGFVANRRAVLRGPMVSSIVTQLLFSTDWGELDYLVVDMPPGTGDIQITLCQEIKFDGAVVVTTPQRLSFIDTAKGIEMFQDLKVPVFAVLQNMAYYDCEKCSHKGHLFGPGHVKVLTEQYGILGSFQLPLVPIISECSDKGTPTVAVLPASHPVGVIFGQLASHMQTQIAKPIQPIFVKYQAKDNIIMVKKDKIEKKIHPKLLRLQCRCAECVNEFTGQKLLRDEKVPDSVFPRAIKGKGNYAVGIEWSDGHRSSIYPYDRLLSAQILDYK